ncbi:unnamed protein product [Effrenium voratum]|uniref:Uncharacterized protein n=1 Tax=Effrenium voratum TaxID=2562239 RepID=A0AA36IDW5_9DINO|nr:unnamed protein product [Effrenium voratum]
MEELPPTLAWGDQRWAGTQEPPAAQTEAEVAPTQLWTPGMIPLPPASWGDHDQALAETQVAETQAAGTQDICEAFLEGLAPGDPDSMLRPKADETSGVPAIAAMLADAAEVLDATGDRDIGMEQPANASEADTSEPKLDNLCQKVREAGLPLAKAEVKASSSATPKRRLNGKTPPARPVATPARGRGRPSRPSVSSAEKLKRPQKLKELGGHTLQPRQQGCRVRVAGDGWGGPGDSYEAIITEADSSTFTVVAVSGPSTWKETHVLQDCCVILETPAGKVRTRNEGPSSRSRCW